jgi:hypothetical protein
MGNGLPSQEADRGAALRDRVTLQFFHRLFFEEQPNGPTVPSGSCSLTSINTRLPHAPPAGIDHLTRLALVLVARANCFFGALSIPAGAFRLSLRSGRRGADGAGGFFPGSHLDATPAAAVMFRRGLRTMTVLLVTALHAAETLATYHRVRAENSAGDARAFHQDMDRRCSDDAEDIRLKIAGVGVTVEDQDLALRQRDLATAQAIIDRHQIMHGIPVEDVPAAREAMARDIASALFGARGGLLSA